MQETVLIVEDNHDLRVCQRQVLEERGLRVASATNGKDALNIIQSGFNPKLIILDLAMPIMDGEEFLSVLKKKDLCPEAKLMIVSGTKAQGPKADDCVIFPKPIDWQKFVAQTFDSLSKKLYETN